MALTDIRPETASPSSDTADDGATRTLPTSVERVLGSGDHKTVGRIFIGASLLFVACDLVIAALVNLNAAAGTDYFLDPTVANRFGLNNPIALLFCGAMPLVLGLAIYLVPLQVGSPTIAFPRAAALSLWSWLGGTALFTVAMLVKGSYGGSSLKLTRLGHVSFGLLAVSMLVGAVCVMVTVMSHRTAGMTISRVPFFSFSMLVTGALWLVTLPPLLAIITVWEIRRPSTDDLELSAYPALTWIFHQPAIYIVAIPLLGILADTCGAVGRQRQRSYSLVQGLIVAFGALSFGAWAQTEATRQTLVWVVAAVAIAIPVVATLGASLDTLRRGKFAVTGGLVIVVTSAVLLLVAATVGALQGISTVGHGQWFDLASGGFGTAGPGVSIGQFYLVIAAVVVGGIGATFQWGTRLFKGGLPKGAGLALAPLALIGGLAFGLGHVIMGLAQPGADGAKALATVSGVGAGVLALLSLGVFGAVVKAAVDTNSDSVVVADEEPAGGTFEWLTASPPVAGNFAADLAAVESEYPVLDLNEEGAS